jgi:hypothetical protein
MKKKVSILRGIVVILIIIIIGLTASYLIGTGLRKACNEVLTEYSVSEDGSELTFRVSSVESIGYVRGFKDKGGGVKPHYITFYYTFGGINSSFGAKDTFTLELSPDDTEIYFNRSNGGYELVLIKDKETSQWRKAAQ